jgi:hypothetical protein
MRSTDVVQTTQHGEQLHVLIISSGYLALLRLVLGGQAAQAVSAHLDVLQLLAPYLYAHAASAILFVDGEGGTSVQVNTSPIDFLLCMLPCLGCLHAATAEIVAGGQPHLRAADHKSSTMVAVYAALFAPPARCYC